MGVLDGSLVWHIHTALLPTALLLLLLAAILPHTQPEKIVILVYNYDKRCRGYSVCLHLDLFLASLSMNTNCTASQLTGSIVTGCLACTCCHGDSPFSVPIMRCSVARSASCERRGSSSGWVLACGGGGNGVTSVTGATEVGSQ